jgi:hypothetical protein
MWEKKKRVQWLKSKFVSEIWHPAPGKGISGGEANNGNTTYIQTNVLHLFLKMFLYKNI